MFNKIASVFSLTIVACAFTNPVFLAWFWMRMQPFFDIGLY